METKRDRFVRLAEKRTEAVLNGIRLLENLSNKSNYEYSDEDVAKILKAIKSSVSDLEHKFSGASSSKNRFKL